MLPVMNVETIYSSNPNSKLSNSVYSHQWREKSGVKVLFLNPIPVSPQIFLSAWTWSCKILRRGCKKDKILIHDGKKFTVGN